MNFSLRLRELRKRNKYTRVHVANSINITESQYQRLESAHSKPSYDTLLALADFFDVSIDYLVGRTDNLNSHK